MLARVQSFELETEKHCCAACLCDIEKGINILKSQEKDPHPVFYSRLGPCVIYILDPFSSNKY